MQRAFTANGADDAMARLFFSPRKPQNP
ncbi:hypothetical protein J2X66_000620 [Pseudomonas sp. 3296]|nr:hypothetical protein [Pseudomonas sp. 3296]